MSKVRSAKELTKRSSGTKIPREKEVPTLRTLPVEQAAARCHGGLAVRHSALVECLPDTSPQLRHWGSALLYTSL